MRKGSILKIKPGHEANCSSGMVATYFMMLGSCSLVPLATITAIIHSLKAGAISERPLMDRKNLLYLIIPLCVGLLPAAVLWATYSLGLGVCFAAAFLGLWLVWLLGHRYFPKGAWLFLAAGMLAIVLATGHFLGLVLAVLMGMSVAFFAAVTLSYQVAWRIGGRRPVFLLIVFVPLIGVALFAGLLYPVNPAFVKSSVISAGLWPEGPALHIAAMSNDTAKVQKLLDKGTDVNEKRSDGATPLLVASKAGAVEMVRLLLEKGADPGVKNREGNTALSEAAWKGHTEVARLLLDKGADPNGRVSFGQTAFSRAAWGGRPDMVRLLLTRGADVNMADNSGKTPLIEACHQMFDPPKHGGRQEKGKPESDPDNEMFQRAQRERRDRTEIVQLLLEKGADVRAKSDDGETALLDAARHGYTEIVQLLLERGADVNAKTKYAPTTPLNEASQEGFADVVRLLLENGATIPTELGLHELTALGKASIEGYTEVVELLKAAGAKDLGPGFEAASWEKAVGRNDSKTLEELLDRGFDVNARLSYRSRTALMKASEKGELDMVRLLLKRGAHVNTRDDDGKTALSLAYRHKAVIELLKAHGAKE